MDAKKLSISHVHWGFPPIIGGVETHLTTLLPSLTKLGHKVSVLTGAFEGEKDRSQYKGVDVFRHRVMDLNWLSRRGVHGLSEEVRSVFTSFIEETKPDCLHVHNMHYFSEVHASIIQEMAGERNIPLILTAHNVWDDNLFLDLTKKIDWTHIIAVSHFIKREITGTGYDREAITVVHHGVDPRIFSPNVDPAPVFEKYPSLRGRKIVFHPARMGLAKGCDVSIKALRLVRERVPDAVLVLAGSKNIIDWTQSQQSDIAYMMNLTKALGLKENVLVDLFRLEDMPQLYAASQVCVYPSSSPEPFGLTMLEALSSARPMIVTDSGGMPEIVRDGISGYVIPVRDFESLASRIIGLLVDDGLRKRLGSAGRAMVEQQFTKEILAENTLKVYRKFC